MLPLLDWCVGKGACALAELVLGRSEAGGAHVCDCPCLWPEQPWVPCGCGVVPAA